jgi:hypothetical protein
LAGSGSAAILNNFGFAQLREIIDDVWPLQILVAPRFPRRHCHSIPISLARLLSRIRSSATRSPGRQCEVDSLDHVVAKRFADPYRPDTRFKMLSPE